MKQINCNRKYYAYELVDSRDGKPFYVGVGQKHRMFEHEAETQRLLDSGKYELMSCKHKRIAAILEAGGQVQHREIFCTPSLMEAHSR
jgi:hypothetical protein